VGLRGVVDEDPFLGVQFELRAKLLEFLVRGVGLFNQTTQGFKWLVHQNLQEASGVDVSSIDPRRL
jgi:hypothetical protein